MELKMLFNVLEPTTMKLENSTEKIDTTPANLN